MKYILRLRHQEWTAILMNRDGQFVWIEQRDGGDVDIWGERWCLGGDIVHFETKESAEKEAFHMALSEGRIHQIEVVPCGVNQCGICYAVEGE